MKYMGREIDPIKLWEDYVEFPHNLKVDGKFLPKVVCPNPEHDTMKRHFQINVEDGLVHCFAQCGISGTYTKAIATIEGVTEREARKIILRRSAVRGGKISKIARSGSRGNHKRLSSDGKSETGHESLAFSHHIPQFGADYLDGRGITNSSIAKWELGWDAEDRRIVIPGKDLNGHIRLLIKRAVREKDWPKYLYTEGFPKTSLLFGACEIDPRLIRSFGLVIVEGSFDAIVFQQFHLPAVATLGTGISQEQARIVAQLRPRCVYLALDRDVAGIHGIEIAARRLRKEVLRVCRYPKGKFDPAELGEEEAHRFVSRAVPVRKVIRPNSRKGEKVGQEAKVSS